MRMLLSLILLLVIAGSSAYLARKKGRDPVAWFLLSLLLGILALLTLACLSRISKTASPDIEEDEDRILNGGIAIEELPVYIKQWFFLDHEGNQHGPFPVDTLQDFWEEGSIDEESHVWCNGMKNWEPISEIAPLKEALSCRLAVH